MPSGLVKAVGLKQVLGGLESLVDDLEGDVVYVVGSSVEYAVYLEFGTSKMQAYPWLGPAVNDFKSNPTGMVNPDGVESAGQLVEEIALALERQAKKNASAGSGGRSSGTHPDHPKRQTGNLAGSIKAVKVS